MRPLAFNGKFLSARPTGVHRVAEELIRASDEILADRRDRRAVLLHPKDAARDLPLRVIPKRRVGRTTWQIWEQTELPRYADGALLINLCNLGPIAQRDAVTMFHDAQVHETPASYGPAFRRYYRAMQPLIARRHRAVLTVSNYSKDALGRYGVARRSDCHVVPNGADHVSRTPPDRGAARRLGLEPGRFALALASAQPHKNIGLLIDAFRRPELANVTLALFGAEPLEAIARDVPANVAALGSLTDATLFGLMGEAGAFLCPSTTEGFGLPPLEAMALGAPVIAAPCGALPEVLGDAAIWAGSHDDEAWAQALLALIGDPALRRMRSARGRNRAANFTWRRSAARMLAIIDELDRPNTKEAPKWIN